MATFSTRFSQVPLAVAKKIGEEEIRQEQGPESVRKTKPVESKTASRKNGRVKRPTP